MLDKFILPYTWGKNSLQNELFNDDVFIYDTETLSIDITGRLENFLFQWEKSRPVNYFLNMEFLTYLVLFLLKDKVAKKRFINFLIKEFGRVK